MPDSSPNRGQTKHNANMFSFRKESMFTICHGSPRCYPASHFNSGVEAFLLKSELRVFWQIIRAEQKQSNSWFQMTVSDFERPESR